MLRGLFGHIGTGLRSLSRVLEHELTERLDYL